MARPPSTAGGRPHVVSLRLSAAEAELLDAARGSASRAAYLRGLITSQHKTERPVVHDPPVVVGPESPVEVEAHPSTAPPIAVAGRPDPMPPTSEVFHQPSEKLVTNFPPHRHRRVKTQKRWVKGIDVGVWACKECGTLLP